MRCKKIVSIVTVALSLPSWAACSGADEGRAQSNARLQRNDACVDSLLSNLSKPPRAATIMDASIRAAQGFNTGAASRQLLDIEVRAGEAIDLGNVAAELREDAPDGTLVAR